MKRSFNFYAQLSFTLLVCAFLIVPVLMSITAGLTVNYFVGIKSGLTLRWVFEVWELYSDTVYRSLLISVVCLVVVLLIGVPAGYVLVKMKGKLARLIEELLVMPLAIPGLAIALALIISFGQFAEFRRSWVFILVGHILFTLPFMIRSVVAVLSSIDLNTLEEGAASLGAGFWQRFIHVVLPNCRSGILAGSLMVVTLSIGEFNLTWMLHTPMTKTLPVGLADSYASMRLEVGSAYTVIFFFMIFPLLIALQMFASPVNLKKAKKTTQETEVDLPGLGQKSLQKQGR